MAAAGTTTDSLATVADANRIQGSPSAKVWVIEVSDFQCPFCKEWHDAAYQMVVDSYVKTGKVRMAYVNFPLSIHAHAHQAAVAAMCASAQNKFWEMHDALFASQANWEKQHDPTAAFDSLAKSVGVNAASYKACLSSPSITALIAGDQERARSGGVSATPSFWVGGKLIEGAVPAAEMKAAIDQALAEAK
jgi:protein-disulfide isomerase